MLVEINGTFTVEEVTDILIGLACSKLSIQKFIDEGNMESGEPQLEMLWQIDELGNKITSFMRPV